jgi:hypothetical protein
MTAVKVRTKLLKRKGLRRMAALEVSARYFAIQYDGTNGQDVAVAYGLPLSSDNGSYMEMTWAFGNYRLDEGQWMVWRNFGSYKDLQGILSDESYQAAFAPIEAGP